MSRNKWKFHRQTDGQTDRENNEMWLMKVPEWRLFTFFMTKRDRQSEERQTERYKVTESERVCVCVIERERERERGSRGEIEKYLSEDAIRLDNLLLWPPTLLLADANKHIQT